MNITKAQETLLSLLRENLFSLPPATYCDVDWKAVVKESHIQAVSLLAFKNYQDLPIGEDLKEQLQKHLNKYTRANINSIKGHSYAHKMLSKNSIPYSIIKGVASARYYPDPLLRAMGDVDFFVSEDRFDEAYELFLNDGFSVLDKHHAHHYTLDKGSMHLELHFRPMTVPDGEVGEILLEYLSDICEKASLYKDVFAEYIIPSHFHHGLIMLTHLQSHLRSSGVGIRHICDWAVFVNSFSNEEFVSLFEEKLRRVGLWQFAKIVSRIAVKYLGMPEKAWIGEDSEIVDELFFDIINGGNFDKRDTGKAYEGLFISNVHSPDVDKPRIVQLFHSINAIISKKWLFAKYFPLLYPVGWIYFPAVFLFKMMIGRRKANILGAFKKSGRRKKLYESLALFEPEK